MDTKAESIIGINTANTYPPLTKTGLKTYFPELFFSGKSLSLLSFLSIDDIIRKSFLNLLLYYIDSFIPTDIANLHTQRLTFIKGSDGSIPIVLTLVAIVIAHMTVGFYL